MNAHVRYFHWNGECPCHAAGDYELSRIDILVTNCDTGKTTLRCERMAYHLTCIEWPHLWDRPEVDPWGQKEYHRRHYGKSDWGVNEHPAEPENITYPGDSR